MARHARKSVVAFSTSHLHSLRSDRDRISNLTRGEMTIIIVLLAQGWNPEFSSSDELRCWSPKTRWHAQARGASRPVFSYILEDPDDFTHSIVMSFKPTVANLKYLN